MRGGTTSLVNKNIESSLKTPGANKRSIDDEPLAPRKKRNYSDTQEIPAENYYDIDENFVQRILNNYSHKQQYFTSS